MHSIRNKLYYSKQGSSSSLNSSPTSAAVALTREYEDFQRANIFPSVAEDASVVSNSGDTMESPATATTGSTSKVAATPTLEDQQAEIESLRAQLAERDHTINELQRKQQEDRRAHAKLKEKWDLFCSASSSSTTNSGANHKKQQDDQLLKLHAHLEGLEQAKEACMTKAVKLSVELAASKEQVSDLESRLEEAREIIKYQNGTPVSARFLAGALGGGGTPMSSKNSGGGGGGMPMDNNSSRRGSSRRLASPSGTPKAMIHSPAFPPITDIELNTDDDEPSHDQDSHDDDFQVGYRSAPPIHNLSLHDDQDQFDMDNLSVSGRGPDSLSFSQRTYASTGGNTMGTYSERGTRSSSRLPPNHHKPAPAPSRLSFSGLRGFLNNTNNNKTAESEE